mgnify:CR=1 FL=1
MFRSNAGQNRSDRNAPRFDLVASGRSGGRISACLEPRAAGAVGTMRQHAPTVILNVFAAGVSWMHEGAEWCARQALPLEQRIAGRQDRRDREIAKFRCSGDHNDGSQELSAQERAGKTFPVSWDQFHRDCRALTWRLNEVGPFHAVDRDHPRRAGAGGHRARANSAFASSIPSALPATITPSRATLKVLKGVSADTGETRRRHRQGLLIVDDLVDTGKTGRLVRDMMPDAHFASRLRQAAGPAAGRHLHHRSVAGHLDPLSLGYRARRSSRRSATARREVLTSPSLRARSHRKRKSVRGLSASTSAWSRLVSTFLQ